MTQETLETYLALSAARHSHLCPRQVLGARIALAGLAWLGWEAPPGKRLLVILETDGCFADGVEVVTGARIGKRTLRVEDLGKVAATFIDVKGNQALRIAPQPGIRERARLYAPDGVKRYRAQLLGYQQMPDAELLAAYPVRLKQPISRIVSRPGIRVACAGCGEEIINEREVVRDGVTLCRSCAGYGYYHHETGVYPPILQLAEREVAGIV